VWSCRLAAEGTGAAHAGHAEEAAEPAAEVISEVVSEVISEVISEFIWLI
jgi:hypothetical protein